MYPVKMMPAWNIWWVLLSWLCILKEYHWLCLDSSTGHTHSSCHPLPALCCLSCCLTTWRLGQTLGQAAGGSTHCIQWLPRSMKIRGYIINNVKLHTLNISGKVKRVETNLVHRYIPTNYPQHQWLTWMYAERHMEQSWRSCEAGLGDFSLLPGWDGDTTKLGDCSRGDLTKKMGLTHNLHYFILYCG